MDNKKIGSFIKDLLKSKGMNQEDLAKVLNITPQAVSKSLNGSNTFDLVNLKTISDLFKITIDDILAGELQTSTSFMTDQERIVKLGYNAFKNSEEKLKKEWDKKERTVLHYAIEHNKPKIIKEILDSRLFGNRIGNYIDEHNHLENNLIEILIKADMIEELIKYFEVIGLRFQSIPTNYNKSVGECELLWASTDDKIINLIYFYNQNADSTMFANIEKAIKYNNEKVIYLWSEWAKTAKVAWRELPGLSTAIDSKNLKFIETLFSVFAENKRMSGIRQTVRALEVFISSEKILDFLISKSDDNPRRYNFMVIDFNSLLIKFFNEKNFEKFNKYLKYGELDSSFLDNVDFDNIEIDNLLYLFQQGSMPTVIYDNQSSVQNYVNVMNKIILRLTKEIVVQKK